MKTASCYVNEFRPLAQTPVGQKAIDQHKLPPFIDASCRREPDLESAFPSITAICRGEYFAPLLRENDVIAYVTKDFVYPPKAASARRLVAVLQVKESWLAEWTLGLAHALKFMPGGGRKPVATCSGRP